MPGIKHVYYRWMISLEEGVNLFVAISCETGDTKSSLLQLTQTSLQSFQFHSIWTWCLCDLKYFLYMYSLFQVNKAAKGGSREIFFNSLLKYNIINVPLLFMWSELHIYVSIVFLPFHYKCTYIVFIFITVPLSTVL